MLQLKAFCKHSNIYTVIKDRNEWEMLEWYMPLPTTEVGFSIYVLGRVIFFYFKNPRKGQSLSGLEKRQWPWSKQCNELTNVWLGSNTVKHELSCCLCHQHPIWALSPSWVQAISCWSSSQLMHLGRQRYDFCHPCGEQGGGLDSCLADPLLTTTDIWGVNQ